MNFAKVRDVSSPQRANSTDAGIDLFIPNTFRESYLAVGGSILIPSGLKLDVPAGYAFVLMNKSGVASKKQLIVGACVVDQGYQGEINIHVINAGRYAVRLTPGMKIVQGLLIAISDALPMEVKEDDLYDHVSNRGEGGFGSTGVDNSTETSD